jgi:monofunctional biosynthetic peptidoglycan transglycosylase
MANGNRVWKVVKVLLYSVIGLFVTYSVLFSLAATGLIIYASAKIGKPFMEVKKLAQQNPNETLYMKNLRQQLSSAKQPDSLVHSFVPLDSISPNLVNCVLAAEDDGFYMHPGFNLTAMAEAMEYNKAHNNAAKHGASTITQQLAKNLFVGGEKNFKRKYLELGYAVLLEWFLGKDRILELYLNYAQWGKNIFGCEAAAQHYFHKSCRNLTLDQAARLAAILAKPAAMDPRSTSSIFLQKRMNVIANNLYLHRQIDPATFSTIADSSTPLPGSDTAAASQSPSTAGDSGAVSTVQEPAGLF